MHGLSRNVCMSSRTCTHYFSWAPLVRSVRIVKCRHYFTVGSCHPGYSSKAFIYSLTNNNASGHAVYNPVKLKINPYSYYNAVTRCRSWGPRFGWNDIYISNNAASNTDSLTYCGRYYPLPQGILYLVLNVHSMLEATNSHQQISKYSMKQPHKELYPELLTLCFSLLLFVCLWRYDFNVTQFELLRILRSSFPSSLLPIIPRALIRPLRWGPSLLLSL